MSVRSHGTGTYWSRAAQLPADLQKLRQRYLETFPGEAARVDRIAQVPAAFRHLLSLRLELHQADALPRRYRDLADAVAAGAALPGAGSQPVVPGIPTVDATATNDTGANDTGANGGEDDTDFGDQVDRLVAAYAASFGSPSGMAIGDDLLRYFTGSQLVEMALVITLARALAVFDAMARALAD